MKLLFWYVMLCSRFSVQIKVSNILLTPHVYETYIYLQYLSLCHIWSNWTGFQAFFFSLCLIDHPRRWVLRCIVKVVGRFMKINPSGLFPQDRTYSSSKYRSCLKHNLLALDNKNLPLAALSWGNHSGCSCKHNEIGECPRVTFLSLNPCFLHKLSESRLSAISRGSLLPHAQLASSAI